MKKTLGFGSSLFSPSMISRASERVTKSAMVRNTLHKALQKAMKGRTEEQVVYDLDIRKLSGDYLLARDNHLEAEAAYEGIRSSGN